MLCNQDIVEKGGAYYIQISKETREMLKELGKKGRPTTT